MLQVPGRLSRHARSLSAHEPAAESEVIISSEQILNTIMHFLRSACQDLLDAGQGGRRLKFCLVGW